MTDEAINQSFLALQENLKRHIEFVKFLESKCTAVLTASSGIFAVSGIALVNPDLIEYRLVLLNLTAFTFVAITLLAFSYVPLDVRPREVNGMRSLDRNVFFFGDTARMTSEELLKLWGDGPADANAVL